MARSRTVFPRDSGLQFRMLATLFLLGLLYVVFVAVLLSAGAGVGVMVVFIVGLGVLALIEVVTDYRGLVFDLERIQAHYRAPETARDARYAGEPAHGRDLRQPRARRSRDAAARRSPRSRSPLRVVALHVAEHAVDREALAGGSRE